MLSKRKLKGTRKKKLYANAMFLELALKNVQKSAKDYFIYFLTLALGVAMFYSFNSIEKQFTVFQIKDTLSYMSFTVGAMAMVSIFVCIVIGFLIVYANRFLLKRRKKEMGIYMTLGMKEREISSLLFIETLCIGIFAILVGIPIGILVSQGLMMFSAQLMGMPFDRYRFFVSIEAMMGSVVFFFIMFMIIHHFHKKEIRKLELVDLLKADKKNEVWDSKPFFSFLYFVLSILFMLAGYYCMVYDPFQHMLAALGVGIALLSIGTILFFLSIATILLKTFERMKWFYYKGLRMVVLRQLSSKIKSSGLSMAVICILLFLSMSAMAIGPIAGESSVKGTDQSMPYDASITTYYQEQGTNKKHSIKDTLKQQGFPYQDIFSHYAEVTFYYSNDVKGNNFVLNKDQVPSNQQEYLQTNIAIIGIDEYNQSMKIQNKEEITLKENEYIITYNMEEFQKIYQQYQQANRTLNIQGNTMKLKENGIYKQTLQIENVLMNPGTIVVPQHIVNTLTPNRTMFYGNFKDAQQSYSKFVDAVRNMNIDVMWTTKNDAFLEVTMGNVLMSYVGIYLGICFIITAGAILALQQLSQASDHQKQYQILEKMGVKKREMLKSMRIQVIIYFMLPLIIALLHATSLTTLALNNITNLTMLEQLRYILLSGSIVLVLYGSYFIGTYIGSRNMIMDIIKKHDSKNQ